MHRKGNLILSTVLICATALFVSAQAPQNPPDPLRPLRQAISDSGGAVLTSAQESRLLALIDDFRAATKPAAPDASLRNARQNYDKALIEGDATAAAALIPILASEQSKNITPRMQAETLFVTAVVQNLNNGGQLNTLVKLLGTPGTLNMIRALSGPGGGRGGMAPMRKK